MRHCNQSLVASRRRCEGGLPLDKDRVQVCAKLYIKQYGTDAMHQASRNVARLRELGDEKAAGDWLEVVREIEALAGVIRMRQPGQSG